MTPAKHAVSFFGDEAELIERLTEFAADGLAAGDRIITITTPSHASALAAALDLRGFDPQARARVLVFDAEETLNRLSEDGVISTGRVRDWLHPIVAGGRCRVFGEMVSLLAARGQLTAALDLETAADALAHDAGVPVLCAYDSRHVEASRAAIEAAHDLLIDEIPESAAVQPPSGDSRAPCVLLADDFPDAREMYAECLKLAGIDVVTAVDGEDAVRQAQAHVPDLVLMDIRMPGLSGTEAMQRLRQDVRLRGIPIIALTAHALDTERTAILADGFDGVITKPCLPDALLAEVRSRLLARNLAARLAGLNARR